MATTLGADAAAHSVEGAPAKRMSTPFLIRKVLDMSNRFSGRKGSPHNPKERTKTTRDLSMVARAILERICDELWGMTFSWHVPHASSGLWALALTWFSATVANAQPSTFPPLPLDDARIQAVTFHPVGQPIAPPVVSLVVAVPPLATTRARPRL